MNINLLKGVKKLITHANCPDGIASALIIKDALPDIEVVFCQYGPQQKALVPEEGFLFCDFTPYAERSLESPYYLTTKGLEQISAWNAVGAIVLDHHQGCEDLVSLFGDRGVFGFNANAESGAWLAYTEVWKEWKNEHGIVACLLNREYVRAFAFRAATRDTWQRQSSIWRAACAQAAVLMLYPWEYLLDRVGVKLSNQHRNISRDGWKSLTASLEIGEFLLQKQEAEDKKTVAEAHRFEISGFGQKASLRVACFEGGSREASDCQELIGDEVDLVLAWHYFMQDGQAKMKISARSSARSTDNRFDCSLLAKAHGGSGHTGAAGFVLSVDASGGTQDKQPYYMMYQLVTGYLASNTV